MQLITPLKISVFCVALSPKATSTSETLIKCLGVLQLQQSVKDV